MTAFNIPSVFVIDYFEQVLVIRIWLKCCSKLRKKILFVLFLSLNWLTCSKSAIETKG